MEAARRPRVKICCIASLEEARQAVFQGASALGLVSAMPSGPGVVSDPEIRAIAARVPPGVASFLLTSLRDAGSILQQQRFCRTNTLQLCDRLQPGAHRRLREALPGVALVQVVHVCGPESLEEALQVAPEVDALLLDSGNPSLPVKELGGTGRTHDWDVSRQIREEVEIPVWLAGGLNSGNVLEAFERVRPFGLDLCSGVRRRGRLDAVQLGRFFDEVRRIA